MRILIGCEYSGRVRDAFRKRGHDAISCDLLDTEVPGPHYKGDIFDIIEDGFDLGIFHPPCTFLANSGNKHLYIGKKKENGPDLERWANMREGAVFFRRLLTAKIPRICVENPIIHGHAKAIIAMRQTQVIQPWMFGHPETKATCLWLKGLPKLVETNNVKQEMLSLSKSQRNRVHMMSPGPDRWKERSRTFLGIAEAMAEQWGIE